MFKFIKNLFSASPKVRETKHSSEIERYKEDSSGLYRFIKKDKWVDIHDPKRETTLWLETISVHENIDFDEASGKSLSFTADGNTISKGMHYTAKNKSEGTQTGVSVRKYEDGSVRTESSRYPKVYNAKTDLGEKAFQDMMLRHHESMKDKVDSQE